MFVDASVVVAIVNEEPGYQELEKLLDGAGKLYVSPLVKFEAVAALARLHGGENKPRRAEVFNEARAVVEAFFAALAAKEIVIDGKIGGAALDAMATYGRLAGHPAALNFGDCFSYAAAQTYRLKLAYKGDDFAPTDLA